MPYIARRPCGDTGKIDIFRRNHLKWATLSTTSLAQIDTANLRAEGAPGFGWMNKRRVWRRTPQGQPSLKNVIDAAKTGNTEAVGILYRNHVGMVYGYLRACGAPDAEDLTGDVFVGVLRNIKSFEGGPNEFRVWLMTIAYRRLVDARRRGTVRNLDLQEPSSFEGIESFRPLDLPRVEVDPRLIAAFATLTDSQREVLALRFVADLGLERVAAITGRPVGAVKSMQHRALAALRVELSGPVDSDGQALTP